MPIAQPILLAHIRRLAAPESESLTDAELVGRYAEHRDAAAFEVLVWRHGPMVWATCQRILRHQHDVEDAFQAAFLALAQSASSLGTRQAVGGWLHRVAMNAALKLRADRLTTGLTVEIAARAEMDDGELAGAVDEELDRLPDRMRTAFVLCCLEGMSSAEAARELGCPVGTVDSRLHAARTRLRDRLSRRGFGPGVIAGLVAATALTASTVATAVEMGTGVLPRATVAALADFVCRGTTTGAISMKIITVAVLAVAFAGVVWAFGGSENIPLAPVAGAPAAPIPRDASRGEGQISLWRDGHPVVFTPGTKGTTPLGTEFEGKPGRLLIGPDGKILIYIANRSTLRPVDPKKQDKVYIRDGKETREIDPGVSHCRAFWGADGIVYGHGFVQPKWGDPEPPVDLTADFVNWSFDPRTGKAKVLKLPGNVSILDRSADGKAFLVLRYEMPPGAAPGAPKIWADYRLGTIPADGGDLIPLTKLGESTPSELRFSPDGRSVLGTMYRKEDGNLVPELVVFDLKSKTRTAVTVPKDAHVCGSCWSPDGKRVAFIWESQAAYTERNNRFGPIVPGQEKKPVYTVTVARPDGSDAKDVFTEAEYGYGSIDWRGTPVAGNQPPVPPGGAEKPKADKPDDEAAVRSLIKALGDLNSESRAAAAEELRRIVAKYPSGTIYLASKDGGAAAWQEKVNLIKPGTTKAEVLKILPGFAEAPESVEIGSGDSHIVSYRLDYHWMVTIYYRNTDKVIERPTLTRRALQVHVEPPQNFTGTWTTWHVNGQKGHETQYNNGKRDGVLTRYHDNGRKSYEQHYVNDVAHGADTGWFPDGKVSYTARYSKGKKDGTWTHWYANGNKHSEATYDNGKQDGPDTHWHENGQIAGVNDYKDGVKHGREASWDVNGVLEYDRKYVDGKLVE